MDILFYKVFHNIVLFKIILNELSLYRIYNKIIFKNKKLLKEHPFRNYIKSIIYDYPEVLKKNDLPINNGVLKSIEIKTAIMGQHFIPDGIEYIKFSGVLGTSLSTLPKSIKTIKNYTTYDINEKISSSVTSISINCPKITNNLGDGKFFKIPNTIRKLKFLNWYNDGITLKKGDLPNGIINLDLYRYNKLYEHDEDGVLPNSIKHLKLTLKRWDNEINKNIQFYKILPSSLESLILRGYIYLTPKIGLIETKSIKTLSIHFEMGGYTVFPNSLPSSITDLSLSETCFTLVKGFIPNGVINLKLTHVYSGISKNSIPNSVQSLLIDFPIYKSDIFPKSLTCLELFLDPKIYPYEKDNKEFIEDNNNNNNTVNNSNNNDYFEDDLVFRARAFNVKNITRMFYFLPSSLTTLILPLEFKQWDLKLSIKNFKNIKYKDTYYLK